MSTEQQRDQQPTQTPAPQADARREFMKKGGLAAISGAASALVREAVRAAISADLFNDGS
ncbi:hypothetical protein [Streptomyces sp. NPDC002250]|uniref:hypothetical protein n=1 Tax=Streptomyces sp. NPDC002250 TaxID=3364641 RepID=UPI00368D8BFE